MKPKHEKYEGKVAVELNKNGLVCVKEVSMSQEVKYQEKKLIKKEKKVEEKKEKEESKEDKKPEEKEEDQYEMVDKVKTEVSEIPF